MRYTKINYIKEKVMVQKGIEIVQVASDHMTRVSVSVGTNKINNRKIMHTHSYITRSSVQPLTADAATELSALVT